MPGPIFDYIDGAADDEVTYRRNTASFERCDLVPNVLRGVGGVDPIRPRLLSTPLETWHGLLASPQFLTPLWGGFVVCAGWAAVTLVAAYLTVRDRDFTED